MVTRVYQNSILIFSLQFYFLAIHLKYIPPDSAVLLHKIGKFFTEFSNLARLMALFSHHNNEGRKLIGLSILDGALTFT